MAGDRRPKRRRQRTRRAAYYLHPPRVRRHTIHVIDGEVADKPDIPGLDGVPFLGEEMVCILCGRREVSDPTAESNWRRVKLNHAGPTYYACPAEFPPDEGGTRAAFAAAYARFLEACVRAATNA